MLYVCIFDLLCYNKVAVPLYTLLFICGIGPGPPGDPRGIEYLIVLSIIVVFLLHNMNLLRKNSKCVITQFLFYVSLYNLHVKLL